MLRDKCQEMNPVILTPALIYVINNPGCNARITVHDSRGNFVGEEVLTPSMIESLKDTANDTHSFRLRKLGDIARTNKYRKSLAVPREEISLSSSQGYGTVTNPLASSYPSQ